MEKTNSWFDTITLDNQEYGIIIHELNGVYNAYIDDGETIRFMFGLPTADHTPESAMQLAIANAPDYADDFFTTRHST